MTQQEIQAAFSNGSYVNWEKVTAPSGQVGYKVPGTGYILDPFLSSAKGKPVLQRDNRNEAQKQSDREAMATESAQIQLEAQRAQAEAAKNAASPMGQIASVGGPIAGLVVANRLANGKDILPTLPNFPTWLGGSGASGVSAIADAGASAADVASAASGASKAIGAADSALGESTGVLGSAAPYLGVAGTGLGAYGVYNAIKSGDELSGGISGAGMGAGLAAAAPLLGFGPLGWAGYGLMALGGAGLGAGLTSLLHHKSTDEYQKERWGGLLDSGAISEGQYGTWKEARAKDDHVWDDTGVKWNWEDAVQRAKQNPSEFRGVFGNFKTFGKDWAGYAPEAQDAIVSNLINEGLYKSSKGDILIGNEKRAREIRDAVLSGQMGGVAAPTADPTIATKALVKPMTVVNAPVARPGTATPPVVVTQPTTPAPVATVPAPVPATAQAAIPGNVIEFVQPQGYRPDLLPATRNTNLRMGQQLAALMNGGRI